MDPDTGGPPTDWLAFLGAAYFRSSGELNQYGLSARGAAIDTAQPWPEEFPRFTQFWLEPHAEGSNRVTIYALMDSPSLTGAFRLDCTNDGAVVMDVQAELFPRNQIARLGIAPMTSMYWFGENDRRSADDWRPEIHDSDGLSIWNGAGERLWRPLVNPSVVRVNSFVDDNPKGFGLLQRDRAFHNYEDDGVFYDRRPSLWVEPLGEWGRGVVQLVEIPTDDEIHDNIVAYWVPEAPIEAGSEWSFSYRLYWVDQEPFPPEQAARVIHTRLGNGGVPGQPRPPNSRKFVIDFDGGPLERLEKDDEVVPIVTATRGTINNVYALQIVGTKRWRAFFDL
jgi:periplasmic glucans biosynthesis protein